MIGERLALALLPLSGCTAAPARNIGMAASPAADIDPYSSGAAQAVVRKVLTRVAVGNITAALADWRGDADAGRAAVMSVARHGSAAITVGATTDADAGAGQRFITVPFYIGRTGGDAVLHRVADDIEVADPRVHDWSIRSIEFPAGQTTP